MKKYVVICRTAGRWKQRAQGSNKRARGSNKRARGSNKRARGSNKRARGSVTRTCECQGWACMDGRVRVMCGVPERGFT